MNKHLLMKKKLYLDLCALNRPSDAQDQERVIIETEAVVIILASIQKGQTILVASRILEWESNRCRDAERQAKVQNILDWAKIFSEVGAAEIARADVLNGFGLAYEDALHVACAESANADCLLTTDLDLLKICGKFSGKLRVRVCNPVDWVKGD